MMFNPLVEYSFYPALGLLALLLYLLAAVAREYIRWWTSPLNKIPGPARRSFVVGYMPMILHEPFLDPAKRWWKELREKNNGVSPPFFPYSTFFGRYSLMILDPDIIKLILTEPASRDPVRFPKSYFVLKEIIGEGLVTLEGSAWSRHRRIIQPSFNANFLKEALNRSVPAHTQTLISAWRKATNDCNIDVASHMSALTLDVIGDVAFSHDFGASKALALWAHEHDELNAATDPLIHALSSSLKISALGLVLSVIDFAWIEKFLSRKARRTRTLLNEAVDSVIRNARAKVVESDSGEARKKKSLLQILFEATDSESGHGSKTLSDVELRDEIKTFIVAGHETTSTWCYWAMYALAKFPDVQQKLYEEISNHASDTFTPITLEMVAEMDYLSSFLSEVLRLYSPVGMIFRFTTREENWKGYAIPAKTRLILPIHLLHRHPDYWSNPDAFSPERWLNQEECARRHSYCYVPFSAGGRNCVGQRFAEMEVKLIVANIVRAFAVRLAPCMSDKEITFTNYVSMKSKPRIVICVKQR